MTPNKITLLISLLALGSTGCVDPELPAGGYWTCPGPLKKCPDGTSCQGGICKPPDKGVAVPDNKPGDTKVSLDGKGKPDKGKPDQGKPDKGKPDGKIAKDQNAPLDIKLDSTPPADQKIPSDLNVPADTTSPADQKAPSVDLKSSGDQGTIKLPCQWTKQFTPTGNDLLDVWGKSKIDMYAVGENGTLLHHTTGGWQKEKLAAAYDSATFTSVGGIAGKTFIAAGLNILERTGYAAVTPVHTTGGDPILAIGGETKTGLLASGKDKLVLYENNKWAALTISKPTTGEFRALWGKGSLGVDAWVAGSDHVYSIRPGTGGLNWKHTVTVPSTPTPKISDIWSIATHVFAVSGTANGRVTHYDPSLKVQTLNPGNTKALWGVWGASSNAIWVVGAEGIWFYNGTNWTSVTTAIAVTGLRSIHGFNATLIYAVGEGGIILKCAPPP